MYIRVINIKDEEAQVPALWVPVVEEIPSRRNKKSDKNDVSSVTFLSDPTGEINQKIRLGGVSTYYPYDHIYKTDTAYEYDKSIDVESLYQTGESGIYTQIIPVPFSDISVNGINLNPSVVNFNIEVEKREHDMIIVHLDKSFKYIRSLVEFEYGEVVSTFHTKTGIGCVIKTNVNAIKDAVANSEHGEVTLMMMDTFYKDKFIHLRLWATDSNNGEIVITTSEVKSDKLVPRLNALNEKLEERPIMRRFLRSCPNFITNTVICPTNITEEEASEIFERRGFTDVNSGNVVLRKVNVDESGYIIMDDVFKKTEEALSRAKIKAITLLNCKGRISTFNDLNPLYIFICDETQGVSKVIRCIKTN